MSVKIDKFGRELSLKNKQHKPLFSADCVASFNVCVARFNGMSWSDVCYLIDDEAEQERKQADRVELHKIHEARKQLYQQGLYELEEGEELEM
jgi:hypothetical protein